MNIWLITAALPPGHDGIGDYTSQVAAELAKANQVTILTAEPSPNPIEKVAIDTCFVADIPSSYCNIAKRVAKGQPDWLVLQYNPFLYGKWGRNSVLPKVIRSIKTENSSVKVALMVHETFVPFSNWKFAVMTTWQRLQLRSLGNSADLVFFSIQPWAARFSRWFPGKPVVHLPVGSNMPRKQSDKSVVRAEMGIADSTVVLGFFGLAHPSRSLAAITKAARAVIAQGKDVLVLHIGGESEMIVPVFAGLPFCTTGRLPAEEVSRHLSAIDIYLCPFVDGVSTRRGSFMAGIQHALAVVGTVGPLTDDLLLRHSGSAFVLVPTSDKKAFPDAVVSLIDDHQMISKLSQRAAELFETEFAWSAVARRMITAMRAAAS